MILDCPSIPSVSIRHSRALAFTLIELLTVIAIIGILAGIIIPTVSSVRTTARRVTCISNIRAMGQAITLYTDDSKGRLPPPADGGTIKYWRRAILIYLGSNVDIYRTTLVCPEIQKIFLNAGKTTNPGIGIATYAMNQELSKLPSGLVDTSGKSDMAFADIRNPSRTILATEAGLGTAPIANPTYPPYPAITQSIVMRPGNVHNGSQIILFCDGHTMVWKDANRLAQTPYCKDAEQDMWKP